MVHRTSARDDTCKLLTQLLDLWKGGSKVSASVVLHPDGSGRFAIEIVDMPEDDTDPARLPPAEPPPDEVDCSCCDRWVWCVLPNGHEGPCVDSENQ